MKKLLSFLSILFLMGCSSLSPELESLMKQHPQIKKEMESLPDNQLSVIRVPTYLPFDPDTVSFFVEKDHQTFNPKYAEVVYTKTGNAELRVTTFFNRIIDIQTDMPMSFELQDGVYADLRMDRTDLKELLWSDKEQRVTYMITLKVEPQTNNPWTKDDVIRTAVSVR